MNKQEQLDAAICIAAQEHKGQFDKGGKPYILHPLHLMNQLLFDSQLATIAVLHDVVEDTAITVGGLKESGFSARVLSALTCLTHEKGQPYDDYIEGICSNYDAIRVKRKDIQHNCDVTRLKGVTEKDLARVEKYQKAYVRLTEAKRDYERSC